MAYMRMRHGTVMVNSSAFGGLCGHVDHMVLYNVYVRGIDSSIFSLRYLILPQPAGFGSEPGTGSGMTVSVLGVTSYLGGVRTGL